MESLPHPDTPPKHKTAADGYQERSVGGVTPTPAERSERVPTNRGAKDITKTPIGDVVYDDAG